MPAYEADLQKFTGYDTQVLGISADPLPTLEAWNKHLGNLNYPILSDFWPHGNTALKYGAFREEGITERAIFIVDKEGVVRYIDVHDITKQPDNEELFSILRKL
jgi:peroxiredoxin